MGGTWGNNFKLSIFGESHGYGIGIIIDGIPPGVELDLDYIRNELERRAPGLNELVTSRKETDDFLIMSGLFKGLTTGTPLCVLIQNKNEISTDYDMIKNFVRPSHGDYSGYVKYKGFNDYRGGGHFSGRLTAPLVFAGAVCKQIIDKKGIFIGSHIKSIYKYEDNEFDKTNIDEKLLKELNASDFPLINNLMKEKLKKAILKAKEDKDSVGGIIETAVINLMTGLGDPFFDSFESSLSHLIFSIPGVKGIEFGKGFGISELMGSEANDEYFIKNEKIFTKTNNNGGITGGITNGMPLIFKVALKPTPSIGIAQNTVDTLKMENVKFELKGRHDPCIVLRAIPVVEAVTAITIYDQILNTMKWL